MEKNNKMKFLAVIASILLVIIMVSASFAYFGSFNVNLNNNVAVNINAVSPGNATLISKSAVLNLQVPASSMSQTNAGNLASEASATLTVELTGSPNLSTTCTYDVVYEYSGSNVYGTSPLTKNGDKEITIQVESPNGTNNFSTEKNFDSSNISSYKNGNVYTLVSGISISSMGSKTTQDIKITSRYYNLNTSQDNLAGKDFTGKIYAVKKTCETKEIEYARTTILKNNGGESAIKAKGIPDFTQKATTNEGMYAAEDDLGTSYYFRGAVDNNWVKFGNDSSGNDIYWRIIRINGDGSIRMIYTGTSAPTESTKVVMTGTGTQIGTSVFNSSYDKSEYVGYMYTDGEQHGNSTDSTIKTTIDSWHKTTTLETDSATKALLSQEQIFCNDRSVITFSPWSSSPSSNLYYEPLLRLEGSDEADPWPELKCITESDKFTSKKSSIGNKILDYPVGLITADEVAMAGGVYDTSNSSYYLYTNQDYLSGSPSGFSSNNLTVSVFIVYSSGALSFNNVNYNYGARPVISLSSNAKLSGDGTWNNVYTVS